MSSNKAYQRGYLQACNEIARGFNPNLGVSNTTSINTNSRRVLRRSGFTAKFARTNRRNRRGGIEVNRAEGGYKNMLPRRKVKQIPINKYFNLVAHKVGDSYVYGVDAGTAQSFAYHLDLQTELAGAQEMIDYLKMSDQYKVIGVNVNLEVDRIPNAGDILPKLLMYYDTDKFTTAFPKTASNVMHLSVSTLGNKNYNVLLNRNTIPKDFVGWIDTATAYSTKLRLQIGQANNCYLYGNPESDTRLGTIKVTFNVKFRLRDQAFDQNKIENLTIQQKIERGIFKDEPRVKEMATQTENEMVDEAIQTLDDKVVCKEEEKEVENKIEEEKEENKIEKEPFDWKEWIKTNKIEYDPRPQTCIQKQELYQKEMNQEALDDYPIIPYYIDRPEKYGVKMGHCVLNNYFNDKKDAIGFIKKSAKLNPNLNYTLLLLRPTREEPKIETKNLDGMNLSNRKKKKMKKKLERRAFNFDENNVFDYDE